MDAEGINVVCDWSGKAKVVVRVGETTPDGVFGAAGIVLAVAPAVSADGVVGLGNERVGEATPDGDFGVAEIVLAVEPAVAADGVVGLGNEADGRDGIDQGLSSAFMFQWNR